MVVFMNNPPAFPTNQYANGISPSGFDTGMTLRDYFAAQALTGAQVWDAVINGKNAQFSAGTEKLAEVAFAVADAMMKARKA
jgi:hypothetical protein